MSLRTEIRYFEKTKKPFEKKKKNNYWKGIKRERQRKQFVVGI